MDSHRLGWINRHILVGVALVLIALVAAPTSRVHAATIIVTTLVDEDEIPNGQCSLREAIQEANSPSGGTTSGCVGGTAGADSITFQVTGTIQVNRSLPTLVSPMTITGPGSITAKPKVFVQGIGDAREGFHIAANPGQIVEIVHLGIIDFKDSGIFVNGGGAHNISNNYIGTDGTRAFPNGSGIIVALNNNTSIRENLISANTHWGIELRNGSQGTNIDGNKIGFTSANYYLPNGDGGISVLGGSTTIIANNQIGNHNGYEDKGIYLDGRILAGSSNNCLGFNYYGLYVENTSTSAFQNNWWGHNSGPMVSLSTWGDPLAGPAMAGVTYSPFTMTRPSVCRATWLSLLRNGSFEKDSDFDGVPDNWTQVGLNLSSDGTEYTSTALTGRNVVKIQGNGMNKQLKQVLNFSGAVGDGYSLIGYSSGSGILVSSGQYNITLTFYCAGGSPPRTVTSYSWPTGTFGWTYRAAGPTAPCTYNQLEVTVTYSLSSGIARFDDISLSLLP